ncbi:P-loop containing nucleoside triphosphate hydrolase protein [Leptodontidium sp. MPI-SDFR-AT-0119]|nr:P-loop containing nucleoside triphosphate hydrolase protein [Leptodontidium sp. MPI-SDFR-AT-0119]
MSRGFASRKRSLRCVKYEFGEEKTANSGIKYFHVKARYLDFDGKVFGETSSEHAIEKFRGAKQITALEVFPLKYHPSERQVRTHLTECGRKFLSMMDVHLCEYKGKGFYIEKDRVVEIPIESRVVVDAAYFREENPNYARPSIKNSDKGSLAGWHVIDFDDAEEVSASAKNNGIDLLEVRGDDLLICSPTVPAFSLGDRRWAEVAVANIKEIDWKQAALDDLHIPLRKKKARAMTYSFDDVVVGKGQGFSVLLHGLPGVGKTLTAELIAEHLRRPLMPVSAGELSTTAETVEKWLPRIFKLASRWKAVLLLDEADVLLEQRSSHDIHRNALIDDAIASRIYFKLKYDKLNLEQRSNVWRYFLGTARKGRNGREIKNLVSTAQALAIQEGCQVTMSHLEVAIAASEDFECDFKGVGSTEAMNGYA